MTDAWLACGTELAKGHFLPPLHENVLTEGNRVVGPDYGSGMVGRDWPGHRPRGAAQSVLARPRRFGRIAGWWILLAGLPTSGGAADHLAVVPTPQEVRWHGDPLLIDESSRIVIGPNASAEACFAAAELRSALRQILHGALAIDDQTADGGPANSILVGSPATDPAVADRMAAYGLELTDAMGDEGYVVGVGSKGVVIGARAGPGILYGTMTLRQMLQARGPGRPLAGVCIRDWPQMKMRGIQDEISYGQVSTMENFKQIIRFLAEYKMNTMFVYLEDTFRFRKYPTIGIGRGALTCEQVDELEAFARSYHVEIVPIFEMLGNQGALLMLDEVRPFAEYPGAHSFAIDEPAFEFLSNCFAELADAFDSKYFHAGLDESWDLGFGKTEPLVEREGRGPVHAAHYRRLHELLTRRGKTMIMYADIILSRPQILSLIPQDIVLMDWHYEPALHYPSVPQLAEHGFPLMVLPGMSNWDRFFPMMAGATINIRNFTRDGVRHQALGSCTSTWGDNGSKNLRELLYFGYAYGAEVSWSPQSCDPVDFARRFFTLHNGAGTSAQFQAIYALLEKWPWWYPLLDYFRHPFLPRKDERPHTELELVRVADDARVAEALVESLRPLVERRRGDLDYLTYCARSHQHYVQSQRLVRELARFEEGNQTASSQPAARARLLAEIDAVRSETVRLRETFRDLWLRTNRPANLHYAIDDYNRLVRVWDDAYDRAAAGVFAYDPRPPADWIYHPDGIQGKRQVPQAFFRRTFALPQPDQIERAGLQLQGDTHLKVYVNGQLLGEQFARRNLSAPVNPQLLRLYDIVPHLVPGTNVIAVAARNYGTMNADLDPGGPPRCGGFHLYGELAQRDGTVETLVSDGHWKVTDAAPDRWTSAEFADGSWPNAEGDQQPTVWVTYPDFARQARGYSDVR
ncbi:MAG: hypothetical protein A2W31_08610 [Planctomycetes bacterium RBG_16_64_10]|nr:MAG: hypothetical protein A2W31_08610 [Planctomycetes bacterium RBG_16_64_10]